MMHPDTELRYINDVIGYGVFATRFIPKGTVVWALDDLDQVLDPSFVERLDPLRKQDVLKYSFKNQHGQYILCWDKARYVNHSFHATCVGTMYDLELAARDIHPGEELTDDYGTLNLDEPFACMPEEGTTRSWVMPDDLLHYHQQWDDSAKEAFRHFDRVEQPLKHLIRPEHRGKIRAIVEQRAELDSIRHLYCEKEWQK
ncbi:SET domain-containing protein [Brevibacillus panacihumi]|uniref:SET domain-containing protein-lysine N-methyltransferase n=1 Tax=Brevibacillus panacihumi TaxID=497735 RepID=A0A3M8CHY4_9BACL|nr:SET domain-containing protein [Brevibacillus panacihumi]RNB74445.1 SET domain-containing protein-lysine N-methyltransferase [Brevibacillus panacihumi]